MTAAKSPGLAPSAINPLMVGIAAPLLTLPVLLLWLTRKPTTEDLSHAILRTVAHGCWDQNPRRIPATWGRLRSCRCQGSLVSRSRLCSQRHGHGEHVLAIGCSWQNGVDHVSGGLRHSPGGAGAADATATLATEWHESFVPARRTADPDHTQLQPTAVNEGAQLLLDEVGYRALGFGASGKEGLEVFAHGSAQDGLLGLSRPVGVTGGLRFHDRRADFGNNPMQGRSRPRHDG
jgi:hypothetical protein